MFKTVKSKILLITVIMLAVQMIAFICYVHVFRVKTEDLMLSNYKYSVNKFVQEIDSKVLRLEDNSRDLAMIGSLFYKTDRSIPLTQKTIIKTFENYPDSLGGGIWFEPYAVDKNQKRTCFYAYRDKDNNILIDEDFSSEKYDYHNQGWYKQIISQLSKENNIAWSLPYYENQGSETMMITVGSGIYDNGKLIGISTVDWEIESIFKDISEMKPIENGFDYYKQGAPIKDSFALFAIKDYVIASNDPYLDNEKIIGHSLSNIPWFDKNLENELFLKYHNKYYVPYFKYTINGMLLVICVPALEMFKDIYNYIGSLIAVFLVIALTILSMMYWGLNKYIIKPIGKLIKIAEKIGKGEEIEIEIENPEEFVKLASTFDKMTKDIKTATQEKQKINSELAIAQAIQLSSLPNVFNPFPERKEFDIFASMEPAKEVGGDFYDFYFIDNNDDLMFLIADVSGKGFPAALFMMTVKTLINNLAQVGYSQKELVKIINNKVCENNRQGFFVTMLSGIINLKTGKLSLVNCGHNVPLIKHKSGEYEYLTLDSNVPLGIFEDFDYEVNEIQLQPGDIIFTYTDGITEAMDNNQQMYGEQRLKDALNKINDKNDIKEIISEIKQNVKTYTGDAPQSDDITMLCFKYNEKEEKNVKTFNEKAIIQNYKPFCNWLHSAMKEWNVNQELFNEIDMCSEEIFANITFYAYPEKNGDINVVAEKTSNELILTFTDSGIAYNPLEKPDPDITLPPEERPLGGLGIFMVKKMAENVDYERKDNQNILTLTFLIK